MEVIKAEQKHLSEILNYFKAYKYDHDESYLYDEDLDEFQLDEQNPTYLLWENNKLFGVLSFMLEEYFVKGDKTRVRMFHVANQDEKGYRLLFQRAIKDTFPVNTIELFLPSEKEDAICFIKQLGFLPHRISYVMSRVNQPPVDFEFPSGYSLKTFEPGIDEQNFLEVRNEAFKTLKGSEVPLTKEDVEKLYQTPDLLKDGLQILFHQQKAIGVIRMLREEDNTGLYSFVAPIAILPLYHGKGLGTQLLKAGIQIGEKNGLPDCMLAVNGENEQALRLYQKLGFAISFSMECFQYTL